MLDKLVKTKNKKAVIMFLIADVFCAGAGMGVPFFCIMLGFPFGWFLAKRFYDPSKNIHKAFHEIFKWSLLGAVFTFILMLIIWGQMIPMLFNPGTDFANFGHPFILYEAEASFIAWFVLMVIISPLLQLLTTIFTAFLTLLKTTKDK